MRARSASACCSITDPGFPISSGGRRCSGRRPNQAHIWTLDELLASAAKQEPTGAPGASYSYSNTNYVLLGEILRVQTGRDWRDVVTENVIKRAKMTQSSLPFPGDRAVPAPVNFGYLDLGDGLVDFTGMDPSMAGASGGHALASPRRPISPPSCRRSWPGSFSTSQQPSI